MRFSFVIAVVVALTTSMSVSACADMFGLCGSSSASHDVCCPPLSCGTGVSMSGSLCIRDSTQQLTFAPCINRILAQTCTAINPLKMDRACRDSESCFFRVSTVVYRTISSSLRS
ncbi:hypothetical protein CY34DRAFT_441447 [Suillus luteus UH-Slu-Lm8-n1]|uniref:Hydrophobin n=1 Tax=Suillus luteus UH-Slu-Lm8-n1 TaxID=930992 RepID=A0A0D0AX55_9AGAM|nr:hypothetical protein CY34DRAFT_441447 [Suillus luteus UH-Slu-Lm8-n1]